MCVVEAAPVAAPRLGHRRSGGASITIQILAIIVMVAILVIVIIIII